MKCPVDGALLVIAERNGIERSATPRNPARTGRAQRRRVRQRAPRQEKTRRPVQEVVRFLIRHPVIRWRACFLLPGYRRRFRAWSLARNIGGVPGAM